MTWTIWINFLPLSHGGSTWKLASVGSGFREDISNTHTHIDATVSISPTHTFLHTGTQQLRVVSDEKLWGGGGREGGFEGKALYFYGGFGVRGGGLFFFFFVCFFFSPVGSWLLWKCIIFCRWWVLLKNAACSNGICRNEKSSYF